MVLGVQKMTAQHTYDHQLPSLRCSPFDRVQGARQLREDRPIIILSANAEGIVVRPKTHPKRTNIINTLFIIGVLNGKRRRIAEVNREAAQ